MNEAVKNALLAKPTPIQLQWYKTDLYGLISYGMPVFNGKQYGDGFAPASMFGPEDMDTDSWCEVAVSAGMKGLVLNVKSCDGFCLWPSAHTDYSVKNSNWMDGQGDLVGMLAESCKKAGLKFGICISVWDRHEKSYGSGDDYDNFFKGLLTELLTNYGEIFYVRLDPTTGASEKRVQNCDWGSIFALIRMLQPEAAIAFMGPDVRWCGNERAMFREEEWATLPAYLGIYEDGSEAKRAGKKQLSLMSEDIGSEKAIKGETEFIYYPCDLAFPIRPKWYYDEDDKYAVKTKDKLLKAYYGSAGNNGCMMIGLAPDKQGRIPETDSQILASFGHDLKIFFGYNLLKKEMSAGASSCAAGKTADCLNEDDDSFWMPDSNDKKPEIILSNPDEEPFDKIVIMENIAGGQAISEFEVLVEEKKGKWKKVYKGKTVGYRKIVPIGPTKTAKIKIRFLDYRQTPQIRYVAVN